MKFFKPNQPVIRELYASALDLNGRNHILYANRSFCHIKMENYGRLGMFDSEYWFVVLNSTGQRNH